MNTVGYSPVTDYSSFDYKLFVRSVDIEQRRAYFIILLPCDGETVLLV